jgi:hypothetical protein
MAKKGHLGFDEKYWSENYSEPEEMDGIANADRHAKYIKAFFEVEYVDINSVIDFGFGLGHIFHQVLGQLVPYRAQGIEPSAHAFKRVDKEWLLPAESTKLKLENIDLVTWARKSKPRSRWFDLGICTSVFQYLEDDEIREVLPVMAQRVKYLYFSVPTDKELDRQVSDLEFHDRYAIRRSQKKYLKMLNDHFTIIGARVLESKIHFDKENTQFTDLLFRF